MIEEETENNKIKVVEKKSIRKETSVNSKDSINWMIYTLFLRQEFDECLILIGKYCKEFDLESSFSMYLKALIKKFKGELNESLDILRKCFNYNNNNILIMKEIGKSLSLMGKFSMAIEIYEEIIMRVENDWECFHEKGLCHMNLKDYDTAMACFQQALSIFNNEYTLIEIGKMYLMQNDFENAIEKYKEALNLVPDNSELYTAIGAIYLKLGYSDGALENFTQAMNLDSSFSNALLGVASIYQDKLEYESALIKYKLASVSNPNSPLIWNNLGLCFFAKQKYVASVTCLKRAIYLDPFEWIISFNLGLVYLTNKQYVSAFHYLNCASNYKYDFYLIYMYLGIILSKLNDISNAINYYDKSLELEPNNYLVYINYTISLINHEMYASAKEKFEGFLNNYTRNENSEDDNEITEMIELIQSKLYG